MLSRNTYIIYDLEATLRKALHLYGADLGWHDNRPDLLVERPCPVEFERLALQVRVRWRSYGLRLDFGYFSVS